MIATVLAPNYFLFPTLLQWGCLLAVTLMLITLVRQVDLSRRVRVALIIAIWLAVIYVFTPAPVFADVVKGCWSLWPMCWLA